jgi:hypothetical protein
VWADDATTVWQHLIKEIPLSESISTNSTSETQTPLPLDDSTESTAEPTTTSPSTTTASGTLDTRTNVIREQDGTLIDPTTQGIIDPTTGYIKDPDTGEYLGIAQQYLNITVCGVSS